MAPLLVPVLGTVVGAPVDRGATGITSGRMASWAAAPSLRTSAPVAPGMDTTSWSLPWITTVASVTPVPLTRFSRIVLASFMDVLDGVFPPGALAVNTTC